MLWSLNDRCVHVVWCFTVSALSLVLYMLQHQAEMSLQHSCPNPTALYAPALQLLEFQLSSKQAAGW